MTRLFDERGIEEWLVANRKFSRNGARIAARNFIQSMVYAGLLTQVGHTDIYTETACVEAPR